MSSSCFTLFVFTLYWLLVFDFHFPLWCASFPSVITLCFPTFPHLFIILCSYLYLSPAHISSHHDSPVSFSWFYFILFLLFPLPFVLLLHQITHFLTTYFSHSITSFTCRFFQDLDMTPCKRKMKENVFFCRHFHSSIISLGNVKIKITFVLLYIILIPKYICKCFLGFMNTWEFLWWVVRHYLDRSNVTSLPSKPYHSLTYREFCTQDTNDSDLYAKNKETLLPLAKLWLKKTDQRRSLVPLFPCPQTLSSTRAEHALGWFRACDLF